MSDRQYRVLVVDDNALIGQLITEILERSGIAVIGPARTIAEAMQAVRTHAVDCALLDVTLREGDVVPVAEELARRSVPYIVMSGRNGYGTLPVALAGAPLLRKPFRARQLIALVTQACGG